MANAPNSLVPPPSPVYLAGEVDILVSTEDTSTPAVEPPIATVGVILLLDPKSIVVSKDPNRLPRAPEDERDQELLHSILAAGGNQVPIQVRQIGAAPARYLLVSGERRLLASKAARLPVRAMVLASAEPTHDCLDRLRENLGRADLSPWEFSQQVRHALMTTKMEQSDLAKALGVSLSKVNRAADLGELPELVVSAFASPSDIRVMDIKRLKDAWNADPDAVGLEVAIIREESNPVVGPKVVDRIEKAVKAQEPVELAPCKSPERKPLQVAGAVIGHSLANAQGGLDMHIEVAMSELQRAEVMEQVANIVYRRVLTKPPARKAKTSGTARDAAAERPPVAQTSFAQPGS